MANSQSTYTAQNIYDDLVARGDLNPGWDEAGYTVRPIITILNTVYKQFCGGEGLFPWKWNQFNLPQFYFNSWQQDYALVAGNSGASVTNLAWLQEGMAIDINNPSMSKPPAYIEVGRNTPRNTGAFISNSAFQKILCTATYLPNSQMYFGTWGCRAGGQRHLGKQSPIGPEWFTIRSFPARRCRTTQSCKSRTRTGICSCSLATARSEPRHLLLRPRH